MYSIDDFKVTRVPWNIYDTVLLAGLVVKVDKKEVKKSEAIEILSHTLRDCGRTINKTIDEKFRNINGITMQYSCMKGVFPGPYKGKGLRNGSKLMEEAVQLYLKDKDRFDQTLKESLRLVKNNCSHELEYYYWLKEKGYDTNEAFDRFNSLNDYCLKNKLITSDLLLTTDEVILENIKSKLTENISFKNKDKNSYNVFLNALKSYNSFVRSFNENDSEKIEYITSLSDMESLSHSESITSSLKADENIINSLKEKDSEFSNEEDIENNWKIENDIVSFKWDQEYLNVNKIPIAENVAKYIEDISQRTTPIWFFYNGLVYGMKINFDIYSKKYSLIFENSFFEKINEDVSHIHKIYFVKRDSTRIHFKLLTELSKEIESIIYDSNKIDYNESNSSILLSSSERHDNISNSLESREDIANYTSNSINGNDNLQIANDFATIAWNGEKGNYIISKIDVEYIKSIRNKISFVWFVYDNIVFFMSIKRPIDHGDNFICKFDDTFRKQVLNNLEKSKKLYLIKQNDKNVPFKLIKENPNELKFENKQLMKSQISNLSARSDSSITSLSLNDNLQLNSSPGSLSLNNNTSVSSQENKITTLKNNSAKINYLVDKDWEVKNNDTVCWIWHEENIGKKSFNVSGDVANCLKRINNSKSAFWFFYEKNIYHMFLKPDYNNFNNYKLSFEHVSFKLLFSQFKEGDLLCFKASDNDAVCIRMTRQKSRFVQKEKNYESNDSSIAKLKDDSLQYDPEDKSELSKEGWNITDNAASLVWNQKYLKKNTICIKLDKEARKFFYANNLTVAKLYNITIQFNEKYFDSFLKYDGTHTYVILSTSLSKELQKIDLNCIKELKFTSRGMSIDTFDLKIEKNVDKTVSSIANENCSESISTSESDLRSNNFGNVFINNKVANNSLSKRIIDNSLISANASTNSSDSDQSSYSKDGASASTSEVLMTSNVNISLSNIDNVKTIHNDEKITSNNEKDSFNDVLYQNDQDSLYSSPYVSDENGIWIVRSKDVVILNWKKEYLKSGIPITTKVASFFHICDDLFIERKFDFILLTLGAKKYSCMIRLKSYKNGIEKVHLYLSANIYKHLRIYENSLINGTHGIEFVKKGSSKRSYSIYVVKLDYNTSLAKRSEPEKVNKAVKKAKHTSFYHFLGADKNSDEIYAKVSLAGYLEKDILLGFNKKKIFNWKELLDSDLYLDGSYNGQITSIVTAYAKLKQDIKHHKIKLTDDITQNGNKQRQNSSLNVDKVSWVIYGDSYAELYCPVEIFKSQEIPINSKSAEIFFNIDSNSEGKSYIFKLIYGRYAFKIKRIDENLYAFKIPVPIYDMLRSTQSGNIRVNITKSKSGYDYDYKFEIYNHSSKVSINSHISNAFSIDSDENNNASDNDEHRISRTKTEKENLQKVDIDHAKVSNKQLTEEQQKYQKILSQYFKNGYRIGDKIAVRQFKMRWRKEFSEELTLTNEKIESIICEVTIQIEGNNGRCFCYVPSTMLSEEKANRIHKYILDVFDEGKDIVYYSSLYEYFKDDLIDTNISSVNILKELLKYLYADEFFFGEDSIESKESTKIDANSMILNYLISQDHNILVSDLNKEFSNIPAEKISDILRSHNSIIFNRNGKNAEVFHADVLDLTKDEYQKIRSFMKNEIQNYQYLTDVQLYKWAKENMEEFFGKYDWLTQIGLRDAIAYKFRNEIYLNSKIFCSIEDIYDVDRVYEEFGLYHSAFTVNDLRNLAEELGGNINLKKVFKNSVRINQNDFVSKENIHFDVTQTDQTIENFISSEYIPITAIQQFAFFPNCGYPWNHYLLQSYLISYSRKFDFLCRSLGIGNYAGAILARNSRFNDYDDVLIDVLANANIQLTTNNANQYLMDNHYIFNKITKLNIGSIGKKSESY